MQENAIQSLGYPRITSFMRLYNDTKNYQQSFVESFGEEVSPTASLVQRALMHEPVLYQVAQVSYCYKKGEPTRIKANWLQERKGLFLGSTEKSREIKYKSLEREMLGYIQGYLLGYDD